MLFHEGANAVLIRLDAGAHAWADLIVTLATDLGVPPDALNHILPVIVRPEDFRHGAVGAAVIFEQFFEPVFGLRIADRVTGRFERRREDVRDAEFVAIEGRFIFSGAGRR